MICKKLKILCHVKHWVNIFQKSLKQQETEFCHTLQTVVLYRLRDRGKQQAPPPKKGRPGSTRKDRQRQQMEKPTQRSNQVHKYFCCIC